ncbi:unannotated protein [freshwater metagenome]|uniref:Unannotated protein n=1 Tax=freshwater metagenome TaxID=449393 RepID=A0A6J7CV82_9ZZZZ|nr:NTPase KAP [Actinomycetota bacterium]
MTKAKKPPMDNPIRTSKEDVLGRAEVAKDFAKNLRSLDSSEGLVVGVLGPWGSGKSSFVNLMKEQFSSAPALTVVEFNPWMFSGEHQLVDVFFREVASELRLKDKSKFGAIADGLDEYGDVLSPIAMVPFVGGWWDRTFRAYKSARMWWKVRGSQPLRTKVSKVLAGLENPIVVVVDDIDRLSTDEIREVFKLVRLTASFPNIIYVLAFDRKRVEAALDETNVPGRAYLEKIVQLCFDLPVIPRELIRSQVFARLDPILDGVKDLRFNQDDWSDVYFEVVEPLLTSLRDVSRLAVSAQPTVRALGSEVETVDLIALEAIRIFRPEFFEKIHAVRTTLTEVSDPWGDRDRARQKAEIDALLLMAGDDADIVKKLIRRVFPAARRYTENTSYGHDFLAGWRRDHRVAHIDYLNQYLERTAPAGAISFRRAEKAFSLFTDQTALEEYLDSVPSTELEDTISGLEAYEQVYPLASVVPASIALLNRIHLIPERESRGMFDMMRSDLVVGRVVLRILRRLELEADREVAAKSILPELTSYSTKFDFLTTIGYREGAGHKLVSESFAASLELAFARQVQARHSPVPQQEWDLLRTYWFVSETLGTSFKRPIFKNVDEIRAIFKSGRSVSRSQSFDSRSVKTEEHLWWDALMKVIGSEAAIKKAAVALRLHDGESDLVLLIEKYLSGWRPSSDS